MNEAARLRGLVGQMRRNLSCAITDGDAAFQAEIARLKNTANALEQRVLDLTDSLKIAQATAAKLANQLQALEGHLGQEPPPSATVQQIHRIGDEALRSAAGLRPSSRIGQPR